MDGADVPAPGFAPPDPATRAIGDGVRRSAPAGIWVVVAALATGWSIIAFGVLITLFADRRESCTANRGDAYRSCVRSEDVTELAAEAVAIGTASVALVLALRMLRADADLAARPMRLLALAAGALLVVCVAIWVDGGRGGWAPTRPFRYDRIPAEWGHLAMAVGLGAGTLAGALVPVRRAGATG